MIKIRINRTFSKIKKFCINMGTLTPYLQETYLATHK